MEFCANCLDVRLFLRYDIDEPLPWHSTISRTRQLLGEEVFVSLFKNVLALCVQKGMVRGKRQAIDSAYVKANASMDSLLEKVVVEDGELYLSELNEQSEYRVSAEKKEDVERHHRWKREAYQDMPGHARPDRVDEFGNLIRPRFLSNHTHYSPTDPDARIAVKPGKARQLNYSAQLAVDDAHHVITGAMADHADKRDSQSLPAILEKTIENLRENEIQVSQILTDAGYSSGESLRCLQQNNIDAYIPNFGQYKPEREGFIYNEKLDQYECQRGNRATLPFKKMDKSHDNYEMKKYRSSSNDCRDCPLRSTCIGKSDFKTITHSIDKPLYDAMHKKLQHPYAKRLMKKRSSTVEPVLGSLINFFGMKRVFTRGLAQANKHVLMSAIVYNLKKLLNFNVKTAKPSVHMLFRDFKEHILTISRFIFNPFINLMRPSRLILAIVEQS